MKSKVISILTIAALFYNCVTNKKSTPDIDSSVNSDFLSEIETLKNYFHIPGLQAMILRDGEIIFEENLGYADLESKRPVDSTTVFPIASITKIFSGLALLELEQEGKLNLDDPILNYVGNTEIPENIKVKHVASHTSQGVVGEHFYYSGRFGWLTNVIANSSGKSYEDNIKNRILSPVEMKDTFFMENEDSFDSYKQRLALPYFFEGQNENGNLEYGFSASAGLVSNARDIAKLDRAINKDPKLNKAFKEMIVPLKKDLPYAKAVFVQNYLDHEIIWGYGQYDFYSSLYLKVPSKNLTLILFANNSLMSDPARLIYGDVTKSLFAMSFLKNYVLKTPDMNLFETNESLGGGNILVSEFKRDLLLAQSLSASYMARYDIENMSLSQNILKYVFKTYPNYLDYSNMSVMHNLTFLKDVAFYMDLGEFDHFDNEIENIGKKELDIDPFNPYVNTYLGNYYSRKNQNEKALKFFENIVNASNLSPNWYTKEAELWFQQNATNP